MSWLNRLIDKIFGRQKKSFKTVQAASSLSRGNKNSPSKRVIDTNTGYSEGCLGYVLKHIPRPTPAMHLYDLNTPPAIAPDARDHLQARITQIPPMPEIWRQVQDILQRDDASASDLGQCVAQDPVLTAHILKACNSASYAAAGAAEISNIPLAIARLGLDEASSIIFRSLAPDLGGSEQRKKEIRHVWFHSQAIALLSRILAEPAGKLSRHDATLIGMLHDIGKLVILHIEDEQKLNHLKVLINQGKPGLVAEQETLGYTHIDAGMMLALHWKLPRSIHHFIYFHHHTCWHGMDSWPNDVQPAIMLVHLSHIMLSTMLTDEDMPNIWQQNMRSHVPESKKLLHRSLHLPVSDVGFYNQMEHELQRLRLQFPDLFSQESE